MLRVLKRGWGPAGLVLLLLLVLLGGEQVAQALKKGRFVATRDPGPGFISQATSGPPLQVSSTDLVANLNVDMVDGLHAAAFAAVAHTHPGTDIVSAVAQALNASNADTLDGLDSTFFASLGANNFTGNQAVNGTVTATGFVGDGSGLTNIPSSQISGPNPLQIALLRWYEASQNGASFPVGEVSNNPQGVAFDGANIWVTNRLGDNITKLRASDGANLGTFAVGNGPIGVAFDGAHIWVANQGSTTVSKL